MSINFTPFLFGAFEIIWPERERLIFVALITIPALILGIIPFLRLNKKRRASSKHLIPFIIHMSLILVLSFVFAGIYQKEKIYGQTISGESVIMFVVDMSDSSSPSKENMNEYMHELIDIVDETNEKAEVGQTKYGLVVFGGAENNGIIKTVNGKNYLAPGELDTDSKDFLESYVKKDGEQRDASNIAVALDEAYNVLSNSKYADKQKKVVLLSDGRQIGGSDPQEIANKMASSDINLSCMFFDFVRDETDQREIQVISLTTNGRVREGEEVEAEIIVKSTSAVTNARIILSDITGAPITNTQYVNIPEGTSRHTVKFTPTRYSPDIDPDEVDLKAQTKVEETGVQAVKVDVLLPMGEDILPLNNSFYSWYTFETKGKILIVYGDGTQLSQIDKVGDKIDLSEYIVERCATSQFPRSLEKMLEYDEIVLMNVDYTKLTDNPTQAINNIKRYVEEIGRGVLITTGDNIFDENGGEDGKGAFVDSPINDIFPVELHLEEEKETIGMVLVVDLSSSMKATVSDSGVICKKCDFFYEEGAPTNKVCTNCEQASTFSIPTRYHVVLESIKKVIRESTFEPEDYIGVIVFDQDYHVALEIQPIGDEANREVLCDAMANELEHYYYAHYVDKVTGEETDIRINFTLDGYPGSGNEYVDGDDAKYALPEDYNANKAGSGGFSGGQDKANGASIKTYGTSYKWPIQEASAMLARAQKLAGSLEIKQVVFMSDGAPNDKGSGYEGIVERMAKGGTVTSSIAIGISGTDATAIAELEKISIAGKGDLFLVNKASDLNEDLAGIVESIQGELLNKDIDVTPIRYSLNSTVHEGMSDVEYDTIHGYYGSEIREGAECVIYVDNLRPLYAEWNYGLGKVCIFMSDLGSEEWTGEMFDDSDGKENIRLIQNILVAPIQKRIDSTGLEYEVKRDNENITITVEPYTDLSIRNEIVNGRTYKEVIEATLYKFDTKTGVWQASGTSYQAQLVSGEYRIEIKTDSINDAYVVVLEQHKGSLQVLSSGKEVYLHADFAVDGDDSVKDRTAFMVASTTLPEYNILNDDNSDGYALMLGLSNNDKLLELDEGSNSGSSSDDEIQEVTALGEFTKTEKIKKPDRWITKSMDIPLIALALILFVLDILFRSFVIKKRKKAKAQMTDEEQIASMRGR